MHSSSKIVLAICLSCLGCAAKEIAPKQPVTKQVWPTAERPIVLNQLDRGGGLIFGGLDGKLRNRFVNGGAYARFAISANARIAACISVDWKRTKIRWVTFFDCSGEIMGNVILPPTPKMKVMVGMPPTPKMKVMVGMQRTRLLGICLSNRGEAIVTIVRAPPCIARGARLGVKVKGAAEPTIERYYVLSDGTVKKIEAGKDEQIRYLFPPSGGVVMLRTSGEYHLVRPWWVERYDKGLQLRWKKQVNARGLSRLDAKHDFTLYKTGDGGREFLHFRKDGTFDVERPSHN